MRRGSNWIEVDLLAGQIIHINGIPLELIKDTTAGTHRLNIPIAFPHDLNEPEAHQTEQERI